MPFPRAIPALADLTQDLAGPVPVGLLQDWGSGRADLAAAEALLRPFQTAGTVVASDSSGLTRLTREQDLLEVMRAISRPKEILHAVGAAIGGRAVGRWVADNTQMLYPATVAVDTIVDGMHEARCRIASGSRVQVGLCVHPGLFYEIGGTLYGHDAHTVELLAEHHAGPGEILLTQEARDALVDAGAYALRPRAELAAHHAAGVFAVGDAPRRPELVASDPRYPHPFSDDFFEALLGLDSQPDAAAVKRRLYARYQRERAVLLVARERGAGAGDDLTTLLDDLVTNACLDAIVRDTAGSDGALVSSGGGLALLVYPTAREALDVARAIRPRAADNGIRVRIGIDRGALLLFDGRDGAGGIAGDPINIASKIAEDAGVVGRISLTTRAADQAGGCAEGEPFGVTVSGVVLTGVSV